jgi:riboflavin biosynthesis pyrimidine reductase
MAPWIFHSESVPDREKALTERGARLFRVAGGKGGLEPHEIFHALGREGVTSVMVEGGASVLSSLLSLGMWHQVVITVSPRMMTGVQLFIGKEASDARISFEDAIWERHGRDIAVWGVPPPVPGIKLGNRVTN